MLKFLARFFGSRNQRLLRLYQRLVDAANAFEPKMQALKDEDFPALTAAFRERLAAGETTDDLLPEAFAAVREAAKRSLGMRHFDVQFIGGITLHQGKISEMRTGEGKTLVATLPTYLNALPAKGVHVVTVNDYLATRDAEWMGPVYRFLGLSVGVIRSGQTSEEKRAAYGCDITYGTNNEYGFDYLRDNLTFRLEDRVQRGLAFAIVDEVDSILIDEARTPLIISGPAEESTELYQRVNVIVPKLRRAAKAEEADGDAVDGDFWVDEKQRQAHLTEAGHETVEGLFLAEGLLREGESLYDAANIRLMHHLGAALRAHSLYRRDVEYIVRDSEVIIVDEFTGRTMPGRRWSDGLHQAVEAKEGVRIREENQTVASITFQNYFRMYGKLAGMTGTADTEAFEFQQIYGLEVVVIPTHRPAVRKDHSDLVYLSQQDKFAAIVEDIRDCLERKQPVLVGTASIEASEELAALLRKEGIAHEVLNAKQHEREALIVALAGRPGAVTIATNMAGRGTDIVLGGNFEVEKTQAGELDEASVAKLRADWQQRHDQVLAAGGLHIVGTERHDSRRIDNQLRGRSGRQGDPGSSRFYLSLEDNLMRIFGDPERMKALLSRVGMRPGEAIESALLTRQIERAQRKVEAYNFDLRKNLLEYDDVANDQRKVVYAQRFELQQSTEIAEVIGDLRREVVTNTITAHIPAESIEAQWDLAGAANALRNDFGVDMDVKAFMAENAARKGIDLIDHVVDLLGAEYAAKEQQVGVETLRHIEKSVMMQMLDTHWREHLAAMDYMRQGISLRSYAQKNPKQEYKREAFELFTAMLDRIRFDTVTLLQRLQVRSEEEVEREERERAARLSSQLQFQHAEPPPVSGSPEDAAALASAPLQPAAQPAPASAQRELPKIGRNEPCPCGSGRKFKHCHGMI